MGNSADAGGGIYCYFTDPTITDCIISENTAHDRGGGVYFDESSPSISNCMISENSADVYGGGIYCSQTDQTIANCTITGNSADDGGGIYSFDSYSTITNCILWGDTPNEGSGDGPGNPKITYSDIQGGWTGAGNIDADPLFADPANSDYHLTILSPCIDSGMDVGVYDDLDGDARPYGAGFDIGADEYYPLEGLEVFLHDYPDSIGQDETLVFKTGGYNSGPGDAALDEARLSITGPGSTSKILYSGLPLNVAAGDYVLQVVSLHVPFGAPPGWYILTVEILLEGDKLSSAAFYVKVVVG